MATNTSEVKHLEAPKDGAVLVSAQPNISEREIVNERAAIIKILDAAYFSLTDAMAGFQKQWDANPKVAFINSAMAGANEGGAAWISDQGELFDKATWVNLGGKIQSFGGECIDRLATYSKQQYQDLERQVNKHVENPQATLYNWAWWQNVIEKEVKETVEQHVKQIEFVEKQGRDTVHAVAISVEKARKVYKHRNAILNLPVLIAKGDPKPIQSFVEKELMDIDPVLAKGIRNDPRFAIVLEIIADNESVLSYLAYVGLMIEAIPPNFYAYIAGKGAAYIVIEVVLLVVTALLSAGAAAAARVATLIARLVAGSAKVATLGKKLTRAKAAVDAFIRALQDLNEAVDALHALGAKLVRARSKGLTVRGNTKTTLAAKKESIRRDRRCRLCGSTQHSTPRTRPGTVVYK